MVNLLPFEDKNGETVYINQVEIEDNKSAVAERLGFTLEEFTERYIRAAESSVANSQ